MNDSNSSDREPRTVVEQGTRIKGTMASSCPIDVHGRIEGEVETPALHISPSGAVHGKAKVGMVSCEGEVSGEIDADRVILAGRVLDHTIIRARSLSVNLSSEKGKMEVVFGECELSVGDEPAERTVATNDVLTSAPDVSVPEPVAALPSEDPTGESATSMMSAEAPAPAPAPAEVPEATDEAAPAESAEAGEAEGEDTGKSKKKRKNGRDEQRPAVGWSHSPSQPPPGN